MRGSVATYGDPIRRYIESKSEGALGEWDILFASLRDNSTGGSDDLLGRRVNCQRRTQGDRSDGRSLVIGNSQRFSGRGIERGGLSSEMARIAEEGYVSQRQAEGKPVDGSFEYPDHIYRAMRTRPMLVVHLLHIDGKLGLPDLEKPVVAWSISFPHLQESESTVRYMVNTTWLRGIMGDDLDEEEMRGDE